MPPLGSISERKAVISRAAEELEETAEAAVRRVLTKSFEKNCSTAVRESLMEK